MINQILDDLSNYYLSTPRPSFTLGQLKRMGFKLRIPRKRKKRIKSGTASANERNNFYVTR